MLGMKLMYLDAGSGAILPVSQSMIESVANAVDVPVIVGGGISSAEIALRNVKAGADVIVVGNAIEKDPNLIQEIAHAIHSVTPV
jgi:putative glycerol-1-phosphate prenyltransferase